MQKQVHLPLSRAFKISLDSIMTRFWRSIITAAGIFLGIAFLVSVLTQGVLRWPAPPDDIKTGIVRIDGEINAPGDYEAWKDVTVAELQQAGMPEPAIQYAADGRDTLPLREFAEGMSNLKKSDEMLPKSKAWLKEFDRIPKTRLTAPKADGKFTKDELLKKYGMTKQGVKRLLGTNDSITDADMVIAVGKAKAAVKRWNNTKKELEIFRKVDVAKFNKLAASKAHTVSEIVAAVKGTTKNANKDGVMIVNNNGRHMDLALVREPKSGATTVDQGDYIMIPDSGSNYRRLWLVLMSLMVCTIGICNSMLMSVTERFKEIGTMKCLGALDRFVVTLFLLESMFLGMIASLLGAIVGFGAIVLSAGFGKGWATVFQASPGEVVMVFVWAILTGGLLTVIATIAPAIQAAKMPPAAALRMEI